MKRITQMAFAVVCCMTSLVAGASPVPDGLPADTLALVADKAVTFSQLNTQLNGTAVVGRSSPALGTPEREAVLLALLDKAISLNLLYLDAVRQGRLEDLAYKRGVRAFSHVLLAGLYRKHYLGQGIEVSEQEIRGYYAQYLLTDAGLTERLHALIASKLRKQRYAERKSLFRQHLRQDIPIRIYSKELEPEEDYRRSHTAIIAEYGEQRITWGEVKKHLTSLDHGLDIERRLEALDSYIDQELMVRQAKRMGLESDPDYVQHLTEFSIIHLVNTHREKILAGLQPSDVELREHYEKQRERLAAEESRQQQMLVQPTREEAERIRGGLESGESTLLQTAADHSSAPGVQHSPGDPVESPAGWHLPQVTDRRQFRHTGFEDRETREATRRLLLKARLDRYLLALRKTGYPVVVYEENLQRLLREEANWVAAKSKEMETHPRRVRESRDGRRLMVD